MRKIHLIFSDGIDLDVRLFINLMEEEYPIKITKTGDLYNVYTLDGRFIFLTSSACNVELGLKMLYGSKEAK